MVSGRIGLFGFWFRFGVGSGVISSYRFDFALELFECWPFLRSWLTYCMGLPSLFPGFQIGQKEQFSINGRRSLGLLAVCSWLRNSQFGFASRCIYLYLVVSILTQGFWVADASASAIRIFPFLIFWQ